jgi:hypothetical protein
MPRFYGDAFLRRSRNDIAWPSLVWQLDLLPLLALQNHRSATVAGVVLRQWHID